MIKDILWGSGFVAGFFLVLWIGIYPSAFIETLLFSHLKKDGMEGVWAGVISWILVFLFAAFVFLLCLG